MIFFMQHPEQPAELQLGCVVDQRRPDMTPTSHNFRRHRANQLLTSTLPSVAPSLNVDWGPSNTRGYAPGNTMMD